MTAKRPHPTPPLVALLAGAHIVTALGCTGSIGGTTGDGAPGGANGDGTGKFSIRTHAFTAAATWATGPKLTASGYSG